MWQDFVFLVGSVFSILFLAPTLKDHTARVPLGTSLPSAGLGFVYVASFYTMGMTFSATGSLVTGVLWSAIAALRSPSISTVLVEPAADALQSVCSAVAQGNAVRNRIDF